MNGEMLNYYFLKDVIKHIPEEINSELTYDDSLLFNFANFLNIPKFTYLYNPFLKDKYQLDKEFEKDFDSFFLECAISLNQLNDYKRLLFLYSILAIHNFRYHLNPYLVAIKKEKMTLEDCYNMLDVYLSNKAQIDLTKTTLYSLFNEGFHYYDYVEDLIHKPLIRSYKFMGSSGYFTKGYKKFRHFCKKNTVGEWKRGFYRMWDSLFARKKMGKKYFLYSKKMDMDLLNLKRKEYTSKDGIATEAFTDIWNQALNDTLDQINVLNDYLFAHNENKFRKRFNIHPEKKL